jgi:hypothetical protein
MCFWTAVLAVSLSQSAQTNCGAKRIPLIGPGRAIFPITLRRCSVTEFQGGDDPNVSPLPLCLSLVLRGSARHKERYVRLMRDLGEVGMWGFELIYKVSP